jgi:hypothetical protein
MNEQEDIQETYRLGHFFGPENPDGHNVTWDDLSNLKMGDAVVIEAFRSRSRMQVTDYAPECFRAHGRAPDFDGLPGPAMDAMLAAARCPVPDYKPPKGAVGNFDDPELEEIWTHWRDGAPAIGVGNWKGCHGIGQFHSAAVEVDMRGISSQWRAVWIEVLRGVKRKYDAFGLRFTFVDRETRKDMLTGERFEGQIQTRLTFVDRSNGWIGLALVGQNETCTTQPLWLRLLTTWNPRQLILDLISLLGHELAHNCGFGHSRGGMNNPSLISGLPILIPPSDPIFSWLRREFGGEPVGGDTPTPPQPDTVEARLVQLEKLAAENQMKDLIQDIKIDYLVNQRGGN